AARFHADRGRSRVAATYVRTAQRAWQRWGAPVKVISLFESFRERVPTGELIQSESGSPSSQSGGLDMLSVLKAARIVSGEIELDKLLQRSMAVVIESAGAQRGVLLLGSGEGSASGSAGNQELGVEAAADVEQTETPSTAFARTVVDYCQHTQKAVVLEKAFTNELFRDDPHIAATRPASVLAMPLLSQGQPFGVLYLENRLVAGVFTPARLELLEHLAAQAAISLQSAQLFDRLRGREAQWRSLVEHAPDNIAIVDKDGRIEFINRGVNDNGRQLFGRLVTSLFAPEHFFF
ncbi:MAG: GAF domain-containing protein, partial [Myxococcales bacterium]|nr:GAF domain-containing protein [Myxococcales bacterium]